MHQAHHTAVLYKRSSSFSSKQHATLAEEREYKKSLLSPNEFSAHLSNTTTAGEREFLGLRLLCK